MKKNPIFMFIIIALITILYIDGIIAFTFNTAIAKKAEFNVRDIDNIGNRILIIAPHPDDETIATGGLIRNALSQKKRVLVVFITNGDGFTKSAKKYFHLKNVNPSDFYQLGLIRQKEALEALKSLGLSEQNIIFMGYPDKGLKLLWYNNWEKPYTALTGFSYSPYPNSYEKNAPYTGQDLNKNLENIIRTFRPTDIFYPDPNDTNPDHNATSFFVKYTLLKLNLNIKEYTYLVHHYQWPNPWAYVPISYVFPPSSLKDAPDIWYKYNLTLNEENLKWQALNKYLSQMEVMSPFLESFVRRNELFSFYNPKFITQNNKFDPYNFKKEEITIFQDGIKDGPVTAIDKNIDIEWSGSVIHGNKIYFILSTRGNISKNTVYRFQIHFFYKNDIKRADIEVYNNHAHYLNTTEFKNEIDTGYNQNILWISVPIKETPQKIMFSEEIYQDEFLTDKTGWHIIITSP